jgi:hypothetical protein
MQDVSYWLDDTARRLDVKQEIKNTEALATRGFASRGGARKFESDHGCNG